MASTRSLVGLGLLLAWLMRFLPSQGILGRVIIQKSQLLRWEDSDYSNNDCVVEQTANGCEDVKIHFDSNTAFLACGDPKGRASWYPGAGRHDAKSRKDFREKLYKYDIKSKKTTELRIEGLGGDFVTHGIDVIAVPGDSSKVHILAVRHSRGDDAISIFEHTLGTDVVTLVKDVQHPTIKTPNGVVAIGPMEFYITNDHYYVSGVKRYLEESFGPWSWATNVVYCDASQAELQCREVAKGFVHANGIAANDGKVFVGDSQNATVSVFEIESDKSLKLDHRVALGAAADNIKVIPSNGDLVVAVFPTLENLPLYLDNTEKLGKDLLVPAAALRLRKSANYEPELLYKDSGAAISFMTAMAIDPYHGVAIGVGVLQYGGFAVCALGEETLKSLQ
ncbi:hypothetical protein NLU13_5342 [Sarocladium strictum]|uniref:Paraoxonase 2 n=1 Tax=Sarocladium strictum TaxID=5046 RepID=A0AA39GI04_SARSR|nr:hypothetical protein NLU13_5342 [Sarocladium strictum]